MAAEPAAPHEEAPAANPRPEDTRSRSGASLVETLERLGRWTVALLARPRARTAIVGVALILIGALWVTGSIWTFPIVVIGIVMVVVAWVGSRLEGRFAVEWSESGAGFELRARFKAADTHRAGPALPAPAGEIPDADTVQEDPIAGGSGESPHPVDGHAPTIEVDADEFRALVAAAEQLVL
jgi:hypothetical protein